MRRTLGVLVSLAALVAIGYVALPFYTAWAIRHAIRTSDTAYLETAVEWPSVKETLKPSLVEIAVGQTKSSPGGAGLWTRLKTYASRRAVDKLVEGYATPEGLPKVFTYGKFYRERVKGQVDETAKLPFPERMTRFWTRVKRARLTSPTRFEFEIADKFTPTRHYDGVLRLRGWSWKLTELRIGMREVEPAADAEVQEGEEDADESADEPIATEAKP